MVSIFVLNIDNVSSNLSALHSKDSSQPQQLDSSYTVWVRKLLNTVTAHRPSQLPMDIFEQNPSGMLLNFASSMENAGCQENFRVYCYCH